MEATNTNRVLASAAIALLALVFIPAPAMASHGDSLCNVTGSATGVEVNPSHPDAAIPNSLSVSGTGLQLKGALVQGTINGTLNTDQVSGVFSLNTASDKLLAKLTGPGYELDLAFVTSGATAGFTFIGTIHVVGQQPLMLATESLHTFTCS